LKYNACYVPAKQRFVLLDSKCSRNFVWEIFSLLGKRAYDIKWPSRISDLSPFALSFEEYSKNTAHYFKIGGLEHSEERGTETIEVQSSTLSRVLTIYKEGDSKHASYVEKYWGWTS
jgi:hypothetical protein